MRIEIPEQIEPKENILRYLFDNNVKNVRNIDKLRASADKSLIKGNYLFFDSRGEVSLQRKNYLSTEECFTIGNNNTLKLIGYVTFTAEEYFSTMDQHKNEPGRENFESNLLWSPLDSENSCRTDRPIFSNDAGLPAHCGINYIHPAALLNEQPNTAIKMFSHKLFKICELEFVE